LLLLLVYGCTFGRSCVAALPLLSYLTPNAQELLAIADALMDQQAESQVQQVLPQTMHTAQQQQQQQQQQRLQHAGASQHNAGSAAGKPLGSFQQLAARERLLDGVHSPQQLLALLVPAAAVVLRSGAVSFVRWCLHLSAGAVPMRC
jgi:hypothetical protein